MVAFEHYKPEVSARVSESGGVKEKRDAELWAAFTAECDEWIAHLAKDPKYDDLDLYINWAEVDRRPPASGQNHDRP
ncbi:MAG: hypothetical protein ACRDP6_16480 [Actinoallomurus sp.]